MPSGTAERIDARGKQLQDRTLSHLVSRSVTTSSPVLMTVDIPNGINKYSERNK